ncbi:bacteriophage terminase [Streptococcus pneumoniae]|uniref:Bacteriophage terminase n=4 Tax=root TaxID=1 RepID=A0A0B7LWQ9_STREE|nr:terminase large subunit [Streptococcus pneumoniae]APD21844.1 putative terminase large subunit [Streptococcus phage IPP12]APD22156.1 putative terminase large subunit [Streptococcus phage IPP19]APD22744.1 putative terminase large subunit [Streptococcus phage IPP30]EJG53087.1 phage Terminase family protein [Streptococcus pneumoniae 2080076]ELU72651.1 putative phage terminase, large subunit [Streptococcus pneumoniae PNI0008]ELU74805.1 putative phage terminase, large subunit [Streptococcus pneu
MGNLDKAKKYAQHVLTHREEHCEENILAAERFFRDLENPTFEMDEDMVDFVIHFIENVIVHQQGDDMFAVSIRNKPLLLQPWQHFVVVNLFGFYYKGTNERRFKEALIMLARKNGKTSFTAAIALAYQILDTDSGSKCYIVANSVKQAMEAFGFLRFNVERWNDKNIRIKDNNQEHSITANFGDEGSFFIQALANDESRLDSLNGNVIILDEAHTMRNSKKHGLMKKTMSAYRNSMLFVISTAGDIPTGFLANRLKYCQKVLKQLVTDDSFFIFICKANQSADGDVVNYLDENILKMANPSWGVTVSLKALKEEAEQAMNDPQTRNEFFNKTLNIFTNSMNAYFNPDEFIASDSCYDWSLEELARLPIRWYGGADLSRLHDLTAAALYGVYHDGEKDVDICITHAFFPRINAQKKANDDGIPLFGWQSDGWLTMSNTPTVLYDDIVKWFIKMREKGFKIAAVGMDRKFGREFLTKMKQARFKMIDQPQLFYLKSEGFRRIEFKVKNKEFYYLHSDAYEYCVSNVRAIEKVDDAVQYEKLDGDGGTARIDLFDASVFACIQALANLGKGGDVMRFFD